MRREEALLSMTMGYHAHAHSIAEKLASDDPIALYVLRKNKPLLAVAQKANSPMDVRYLGLLSATRDQMGDAETWNKWVKSLYADVGPDANILLLKSALALGDFQMTSFYSQLLPGYVDQAVSNKIAELSVWQRVKSIPHSTFNWLRSLVADAAIRGASILYKNDAEKLKSVLALAVGWTTGPSLGGFIDPFQEKIEYLKTHERGPVSGHEMIASFYEDLFYSGLGAQARFLIYQLSSVPAAKEFLEEIGHPQNPIGTEFRTWLADSIAYKEGMIDLRAAMKDLRDFKNLGMRPLGDLLREFNNRFAGPHPWVYVEISSFTNRLDTRPEFRFILADIIKRRLMNYRYINQLLASMEDDIRLEHAEQYLWREAYARNWSALKAYAHDDFNFPNLQLSAIAYLEWGHALSENDIKKEYIDIVSRRGNLWAVRAAYFKFLKSHHDNDAAIRNFRNGWLAETSRLMVSSMSTRSIL